MKDQATGISDFDLMAYADGRLDPHRRRLVEAWLSENQEENDRVQTDAAITEAIRSLYDPVLVEPVPDRLDSVLHRQRPAVIRTLTRYSAMAASMVGAGVLGWWVGGQTQMPTGAMVDQRLLSQVTTAYLESPGGVSPASATTGAAVAGGAPGGGTGPTAVSTMNDRLTLELSAPDLTPLGYTMVGQRVAATPQGDVVEVNYADATGERLALFMTPRWQETQPRFRATRHNDVSTAYWYDGPLALALAGDGEPEVIRDLGISVHEMMQSYTGAGTGTATGLSTGEAIGFGGESGPVAGAPIQQDSGPAESANRPMPFAGSPVIVPESLIAPATVQQADQEM